MTLMTRIDDLFVVGRRLGSYLLLKAHTGDALPLEGNTNLLGFRLRDPEGVSLSSEGWPFDLTLRVRSYWSDNISFHGWFFLISFGWNTACRVECTF